MGACDGGSGADMAVMRRRGAGLMLETVMVFGLFVVWCRTLFYAERVSRLERRGLRSLHPL